MLRSVLRNVRHLSLYTAVLLLANAVVLPLAADPAAISDLRSGDMRKLNVHSVPVPASDVAFHNEAGQDMTLTDYRGQYVVLNFWATWCAPCRIEMPHLSALQTAFGSDDFSVVTVATGRNAEPAMRRFFDEIGVSNLPLYKDPRQALARDMGVLGLPVTVILNPEGQEIARMQGDADWAGDSAQAIISALLAGN